MINGSEIPAWDYDSTFTPIPMPNAEECWVEANIFNILAAADAFEYPEDVEGMRADCVVE